MFCGNLGLVLAGGFDSGLGITREMVSGSEKEKNVGDEFENSMRVVAHRENCRGAWRLTILGRPVAPEVRENAPSVRGSGDSIASREILGYSFCRITHES
jgi:hypothetical protein